VELFLVAWVDKLGHMVLAAMAAIHIQMVIIALQLDTHLAQAAEPMVELARSWELQESVDGARHLVVVAAYQ
jgi:hypothetical protein